MRKLLFVLALTIGLLLASCGGSNVPTTSLEVTLTDFQFSPNQFTVPAGQEITLEAANTGAVLHDFIIMNLGQSAGTEYTSEDDANMYLKIEVPAGGSESTSFIAPAEPGEYEVVCGIPGHLQAGMVGKLIVVANE